MLDEIAAIATELFVTQGYEQTTVEEICAAAGISRTTFFRYFQTKDDVLAQRFADLGDQLLALVQARPADESAWVALCAALPELAGQYAANPKAAAQAVQLVLDNPSLTTFHQKKLASWTTLLEPEVRSRLQPLGEAVPDPRPYALLTAAFGCLDAALATWVASGATADLPTITRSALNSLS